MIGLSQTMLPLLAISLMPMSALAKPPIPHTEYTCSMWKMDSYADDDSMKEVRAKFPNRWNIKLLVPPSDMPVRELLKIEFGDEVNGSALNTRAVIYPYKDQGKTTNDGDLIHFAGSTLNDDISGNVVFFMIPQSTGRSRLVVHYQVKTSQPFDTFRQIRAAGSCVSTIAFVKDGAK